KNDRALPLYFKRGIKRSTLGLNTIQKAGAKPLAFCYTKKADKEFLCLLFCLYKKTDSKMPSAFVLY
ncbi:MAG: hypothetical protein IJF71_04610, partial [Clostridia bacterium]|nr:hypothetical protein [Clostridia bacterium]